jgi:hypothetical protein
VRTRTRATGAIAAGVLLALAGATTARAQGVTTGDTLAKPTRPDKPQRTDSVQHRMGRGAPLPTIDIGESYTWDRDALFATGALTLGDLLDRLPGYTTYRTGWLTSPQTVAMGGSFSNTRVYIDDVEWDDLNPRSPGIPELHSIPIWALQQLTLARTADGLRVDLRTWQYDLTTPYTRVDIETGDLNTNLYRAFYGKRYYNGAGLQLAGQQYGITDVRNGGGGEELSILGRYGWARPDWSLDATVLRGNDSRTTTQRYGGGMLLPGYRSAHTLAYLRAAIGHEGTGPFVQLQAVTEGLREYSPQYTTATAAQYGFPSDTVDTLASIAQYIATAGYDGGGARVRLVERYRRRLGVGYNSPSAAFDLTQRFLSLSASAERDAYRGVTDVQGGARLTPLPFVSVAAYAELRNGFGTPAPGYVVLPNSRSMRAEAGLRLYGGGPWLVGGVVSRDTALLVPPTLYDTAFIPVSTGKQTGTTIALRGPLGRGFSVDGWFARWDRNTPYTPQYEASGRLRFYTQWLSRFPNGNFSFLIEPSMSYRTRAAFPEAGGSRLTNPFYNPATDYAVLVELRILRGTITYQRRNITNELYDQIPGYIMPRPMNVYGVRWYFFD